MNISMTLLDLPQSDNANLSKTTSTALPEEKQAVASQTIGVALLHRWLDAVNSGCIETICDCYAPDAELLPTFSAEARRLPEQRRQYFAHLAGREGLHVSVDMTTLTEQKLNQDIVILSGRYTWHDKTALPPIEARFTMIIHGELIVHHHSSELPE